MLKQFVGMEVLEEDSLVVALEEEAAEVGRLTLEILGLY